MNVSGPATKICRVRRHEKRVERVRRAIVEELPKCSKCGRGEQHALSDDRVRHGRTIVGPRKYEPWQVDQSGHGGGAEEELKPFAAGAACDARLIEKEYGTGKQAYVDEAIR